MFNELLAYSSSISISDTHESFIFLSQTGVGLTRSSCEMLHSLDIIQTGAETSLPLPFPPPRTPRLPCPWIPRCAVWRQILPAADVCPQRTSGGVAMQCVVVDEDRRIGRVLFRSPMLHHDVTEMRDVVYMSFAYAREHHRPTEAITSWSPCFRPGASMSA